MKTTFYIISPLILFQFFVYVSHVSTRILQENNTICVVTEFAQVQNACKSCSEIVFDNLHVPAGVTLHLNLIGNDNAKLTFTGITTFGYKQWWGPLVTINGTGIVMKGTEDSFFDGQGALYWDGLGELGSPKPQFFTIEAFNSIFKHIVVLNSPIHVAQASNSINVTFDNWLINNEDGNVPITVEGKERKRGSNTDGFDVWNSTDVLIQNSRVLNQDDCVAVRCGANILTRNMVCHGSHGLSISVGFSKDNLALNTLTNVTFEDSTLLSGENGIHIKTHNDGGPGSLSNATYKNIQIFETVKYGIHIQQNYPKGELKGNVPITDLKLYDVRGSVTPHGIPVSILCAEDACADFLFEKVDIDGLRNNSCNFKPNGYDC